MNIYCIFCIIIIFYYCFVCIFVMYFVFCLVRVVRKRFTFFLSDVFKFALYINVVVLMFVVMVCF